MAKTAAVGIFAVTMDTAYLQPGGVMEPETVWMTRTKWAVVSEAEPGVAGLCVAQISVGCSQLCFRGRFRVLLKL